MLAKSFMAWKDRAPAGRRAEATDALVRAYLYSPLSPDETEALEAVMVALLDDLSPHVRFAMAAALGAHPGAPRHVVLALADDQPRIAQQVIECSPALLDPDLVEIVGAGDALRQVAVARREAVSREVSLALAERGGAESCLELLLNDGAVIPRAALDAIVERHGSDADVRAALLARDDLPLDVRQALVSHLSRSLGLFVVERAWLGANRAESVARECRERATLDLAATAGERELGPLVQRLVVAGELSPALLLRAVALGQVGFVVAGFAVLSGQSPDRVTALLGSRRAGPIRTLVTRAGVPNATIEAFVAALSVMTAADEDDMHEDAHLRVAAAIEAIQRAAGRSPSREVEQILALLRRLGMEAKREAAHRRLEVLATAA